MVIQIREEIAVDGSFESPLLTGLCLGEDMLTPKPL